MTEERVTGSNHNFEVINRFIQDRASKFAYQTTLFVQLVNFTREIYIRYLLSYREALISWSGFDDI